MTSNPHGSNLDKGFGNASPHFPREQFIITGSVQLNGDKPTDPTAAISLFVGDVLKLSKKHAVRFVRTARGRVR